MFSFVSQRAYFQAALVFAAGCIAGARAGPPLELIASEWMLWLAAGLAIAALILRLRLPQPGLASLLGFALLCLAGYLNSAVAVNLPLASTLRHYCAQQPADSRHRLLGRIASLPKFRDGHVRFLMQIERARPWVEVEDLAAKESASALPKWPAWQDAKGLCFIFIRSAERIDLQYGDRLQLTSSLEEVAPPSNLGQFDYRGYLLQRGTVLTGYVASAGSLQRLSAGHPVWRWIGQLRERLTFELEQRLPPASAHLAISTVFGDKISEVPEELTERFRAAGLSHILVASGTQVSLLIGILLLSGRRAPGGWILFLRSLLTLCIVLTYAALAGMETSITRALVMGSVVLMTRLLQREPDGLSSLSQAALILLAVSPLQVFNAGFQLSFMATFGLIYLNGITLPLLAERFRLPRESLPQPEPVSTVAWRARLIELIRTRFIELKHSALAALSTTVGAQLFVVPVLACQFNQLSLWGLLSNAIAVPLSFLMLLSGALLSLGLGVLPVLGQLLTTLTGLLCAWLDGLAALFAALPGSDLAIPAMQWWQVLAAYGLLLCCGEAFKLWRSRLNQGSPNRSTMAVAGSGTSQIQLAALQWTAGICCILVVASLCSWLLLPRAELAALSLPGAEAYLWCTARGKCWILARAANLGRSHNAETIAAALRARGISRPSGIIWLDGAPARVPTALAAWRSTELESSRTELELAGARILPGRGTANMILPLGRGRVGLLWKLPANAQPVASADTAVNLLIVPQRLAKALMQRPGLNPRNGGIIVIGNPAVNSDIVLETSAQLSYSERELRLFPRTFLTQ